VLYPGHLCTVLYVNCCFLLLYNNLNNSLTAVALLSTLHISFRHLWHGTGRRSQHVQVARRWVQRS